MFSVPGIPVRSIMTIRNVYQTVSRICCLALWLYCMTAGAVAQSTEAAAPSPVTTNEVLGTISARDLGDARLTDHFYTFTGTPGDLLITVDSKNLNGDVDVFTSSGLRPLMKFSVYAGSSLPVTKSVYLRKREDLILRVEARSPNDDEGSYRLHFGGAFEAISAALLSENKNTLSEPAILPTTPRTGRRVSSVGARIEEPPAPAVAEAPAPETTPSQPADTESKSSVAEESKTVVEEPKVTTSRPASRRGGRRQPGRRTRTPQPAPTEETTTTAEAEKKATEEVGEAESKPAPRGRRSTRRRPAEPPVEPVEESGPRLIIETNDGTLINRYMSSVRRVTVENGRIVVVGIDGKIERIALATVVRMSIAP